MSLPTNNETEFRSAEPLLQAKNLTRHFGSVLAVKDFSLNLQAGEVVALIGANGAGKTTTMRMLAGILQPSSGSVSFCGHDLQKERLQCQQLLGYVPEGAPNWPHMTPREIFKFKTDITSKKTVDQSHLDYIINATNIQHVLDQPMAALSKGYKRRVALVEAFVHNPKVLILDEPTDGLDPRQKQETRHFISASAETKAVLISTHILEEAASICSRVIIFHQGSIRTDLPMDKLPRKGSTLEKLQQLFFEQTDEKTT